MSQTLTPDQTLLIWALLARQGIAPQAEIMPAVKKADREALEREKLVTVTKRSQAFWLRLEDAGWAWAGLHLRDPLPEAHGALFGIMTRLHEHLAQTGGSLADFIGAAPEAPEDIPAEPAKTKTRTKSKAKKPIEAETPPKLKTKTPPEAKAEASTKAKTPAKTKTLTEAETKTPAKAQTPAKPKTPAQPKTAAKAKTPTEAETPTTAKAKTPGRKASSAKTAKAPSAASMRRRLEEAYLAVTGGRKNESAPLSRVRAELADLDRAVVDAALHGVLTGDEKARLMRLNNPKAIDAAEKAAAFDPNGEPFHLLWIEA